MPLMLYARSQQGPFSNQTYLLSPIPYARLSLVGNRDTGCLENVLMYQPSARQIRWQGRYERIKIHNKIPSLLFDTAEGEKPRGLGNEDGHAMENPRVER